MNIKEKTITGADTPAPVSTLADIKARLQARQERDVTKLPTHEHEALGTVHIGFMPTAGYRDIEAASVAPEGNYKDWSVDEKLRYHSDKADRAYLKWGVVTADNQRLDDAVIDLLFSGDYGAENRRLINAVQKQNPPREELSGEMGISYSFNRMTCVLLRILERAGYLKTVRDYLLSEDGSEESKALAEDLSKWEQTLPVWEAYMEADDIAKGFDIGVYKRMSEEKEVREAV